MILCAYDQLSPILELHFQFLQDFRPYFPGPYFWSSFSNLCLGKARGVPDWGKCVGHWERENSSHKNNLAEMGQVVWQ